MKYWSIRRSIDPSVIGVNNAEAQVETFYKKEKKSFCNEQERDYFVEFCRNIWKNRNIYINNFMNIDLCKISEITYFPTKKRVKEVDILGHCTESAFNIFDYVISEKLMAIIDNFCVPEFYKIPATVVGFKSKYYLVGFPIISELEINYGKSVYYNYIDKKDIIFSNYDDYKKMKYDVYAKKLILTKHYDYDILRIQNMLFFSGLLINQMKENNITAFEIENINLEC